MPRNKPGAGSNATHLVDAWFSRLSNGAENRLGEEDFVAGERAFVVHGETSRTVNKLLFGINERIHAY